MIAEEIEAIFIIIDQRTHMNFSWYLHEIVTISDYPNGSDIKNIYHATYIDYNEYFQEKKII